jgi:hypothetical protein
MPLISIAILETLLANGWAITGQADVNGSSSVVNVDVVAICVK